MKKITIVLETDGVMLNVSQSLVNFLSEEVKPLKEYDTCPFSQRYSPPTYEKINLTQVLSNFELAGYYKSIEPMPNCSMLREMLNNPLFDFHFISYAPNTSLKDLQQNIEVLFKSRLEASQFSSIKPIAQDKKTLLKSLQPDFFISQEEVRLSEGLNAVLASIRAKITTHYDIKRLIEELQSHLSDDLLTPLYAKQKRKSLTEGHCYASSEAMYHILGGQIAGLTPMVASFEQNGQKMTHWWLRDKNNKVIDPTAQQFLSIGAKPPYHLGKGAGFLTKAPSKRAQEIINRMLGQEPVLNHKKKKII